MTTTTMKTETEMTMKTTTIDKEWLKSGALNRRYDRPEFSLCKVTKSDGNVHYAICQDYTGCTIETYETLEEAEAALQDENDEYNQFQDEQEWEQKERFGCDCGECDYCEAHTDEDEDDEDVWSEERSPKDTACFADIQNESIRQERMLEASGV